MIRSMTRDNASIGGYLLLNIKTACALFTGDLSIKNIKNKTRIKGSQFQDFGLTATLQSRIESSVKNEEPRMMRL